MLSCIHRRASTIGSSIVTAVLLALAAGVSAKEEPWTFSQDVQPFLGRYCLRCHNAKKMESGIRVDQFNGELNDTRLFLWKAILQQVVADEAMPPEEEPQPTAEERASFAAWIKSAIEEALSRNNAQNGAFRRLTIAQYRNTLRDLLGLKDDLTGVLPADGVSKDGFVNNAQTMALSPLLVETYFDIAERALNLCIVDPSAEPSIQNFRLELGRGINAKPFNGRLILGANSHLLDNSDFLVTQLTARKSFPFEPFVMRTRYRFVEGYQGNDTVRGWRDYDSIYHAVFACMRGNEGYPKGLAYQTIPQGLLLRPAIPSDEVFGAESTYGPKANFKISLRELPDNGNFRVTVTAAKYDDGLLLGSGSEAQPERVENAITVTDPARSSSVEIVESGVYQADVYLAEPRPVTPDRTRLAERLIGAWRLDGDLASARKSNLPGKLAGKAKFVDSPLGGKALLFDGQDSFVAIPRGEEMDVGVGEFTVAAWIRPDGLRQAGIVAAGGYGYTHGWLLDLPNGSGVLRIETANADNQHNGTVESPPGVIRDNAWQHVAVVVRRGENKTKLYVNGFEVAVGTINAASLDNPQIPLHFGRIPNANLFKGEIDNVYFYRRALEPAELKALVEPGSAFVKIPPTEEGRNVTLQLNERRFTGKLLQSAFVAVRLPAGPLSVGAQYEGSLAVDRVVFTPLAARSRLKAEFERFEHRSPWLGVHVGLRRDCGSTLAPVGEPQAVSNTELKDFVFEGAINNFPRPEVEKNNVNYLAGLREIGVRHEFADGRDVPRLLIRAIEFEGPFYASWPPETHAKIFIDSANKEDKPAYAREIIRSFASRAFRRPVTSDEERSLLAVWVDSFAANHDFQQSIKDTLLVVLTSPQFLFLIENSSTPDPELLDEYELAAKLSYFLWNAPPDERLLSLAKTSKLRGSLASETNRMIADDRFRQFAREFTSQWLNLDRFDVVNTDRDMYPRLTHHTKRHLRNEPVEFVQYLIRNNLPLQTLIRSDFILANDVVADYYGLADRAEAGFEFVPIEHGVKNLGGVLTQAAILAGLSDGRHANPIKRGAWLARKIIAEPPDDPPPNVPALRDDDGTLTLREKLELHRGQEACANCHAGIDSWGLPFGAFDAGGLFQPTATNDLRSTLPDSTDVSNLNELKAYLARERIDRVAFSFMKHLASYALGRSLTFREVVLLEENVLQWKSHNYPMQDMMHFIVESEMFLTK